RQEEGTSIKKRAAGWAKTLGLEEKDMVEKLTGFFGADVDAGRKDQPIRLMVSNKKGKRINASACLLHRRCRILSLSRLSVPMRRVARSKERPAPESIKLPQETVEFKIRCRNGKTLHEKSTFQKDRKWGYVYSGESEFAEWS
ncbi:unnamed protein product, partial [Effrenium voratum]